MCLKSQVVKLLSNYQVYIVRNSSIENSICTYLPKILYTCRQEFELAFVVGAC